MNNIEQDHEIKLNVAGVLRIALGGQQDPVIEVHADGRVVAPDVESVSEAGRAFVEAIRSHLAPPSPATREAVARLVLGYAPTDLHDPKPMDWDRWTNALLRADALLAAFTITERAE